MVTIYFFTALSDPWVFGTARSTARLPWSRMKREELARKLAQQSRLSRAQARDQVDEMVRKILKALRKGQPVELPGVGRLVSNPLAGAAAKASAGPARGGNQA